MAEHTVSAGARGAYEKALAADTLDTVSFEDDLASVRVINEGESGLYYTIDGDEPEVGDGAAFYLPPHSVETHSSFRREAPTVIQLIAGEATTYSVSKGE